MNIKSKKTKNPQIEKYKVNLIKLLHHPSRNGKPSLSLISGIILILFVMTAGLDQNTAFSKPNFGLNSVGLECGAQWGALDSLVKDAREKRGSPGWNEATFQDAYKILLEKWYSFCGKIYGNYIIPRGNLNEDLTGGNLNEDLAEEQQQPSKPTSPQGNLNEDLAEEQQQPSKPTSPQGNLNDNTANQLG
jgi:hypothetical protein